MININSWFHTNAKVYGGRQMRVSRVAGLTRRTFLFKDQRKMQSFISEVHRRFAQEKREYTRSTFKLGGFWITFEYGRKR